MSEREVAVARVGDLADGEMKQVEVDGVKILLARVGDRFYATGGVCTHYGAPLAKGVLSGKRVICPWHHAQFDVTSGALLEPPALDCLPAFRVRVDGENVRVVIPEGQKRRCTPEMARPDSAADGRQFVILGAGAAGYSAAQTLREDGFRGRVVMVTRESQLPYDRPNLSKNYLQGGAGPERMPLRSEEFFRQHGIDVMRDSEATQVDIPSRAIQLASGPSLTYDKLLIATGSIPRRLDVPGHDLANIYVLRTWDDCDRIILAAGADRRSVVVGASFIGMEVAASLRKRGVHVTIVAPDNTPFERVFGREVGDLMRRVQEQAGTEFRLGTSVARFEGTAGVEGVVLGSGERIPADFVVVGIGVQPATRIIRGLPLNDDGGIAVDEYFQAAEDVYAAGDVAQFADWRSGVRSRVEHWRTAEQEGRQAAHNMAGRREPYRAVPFFWSRQGDFGITYVGHAVGWEEVIMKGKVNEQNFLAFYVKNGQVQAVAGVGRARQMDAIHELMRQGRMPTVTDIREGQLDFVELLMRG